MNLSPATQAATPSRPQVFARLALESDRGVLLELFRARLTVVSPWLKFDAATANMTLDNYFASANPTVFVAENAERQVVGYLLATFEEYSATAGYAVCQDELAVWPGAEAAEAASVLSDAFEAWAKKLRPEPLEVLVGMDVDLAAGDVVELQRTRGH